MARPAGSKNKLTTAAREAFQMAFNKTGGVQGLTTWAKANPTEFYKLYGRLIPVEVAGDIKHQFEALVIKQSDG